MIVRELITRLGFDADQRKLTAYERGMQSLKRVAVQTASVFAAGFGINEIRRMADEMQSLRARMEQTPQQVGNVAASFEELASHAIAARSSIGSYADFYNRVSFAAKGFLKTQADVLRVTDTVSKALVVGGTSGAERGSVLSQLSQALGSNRLGGDEYRSLREAAPQLVSAMADALGKTRGELDDMAEQGKLTTKVVIGAIDKMGDAFDERFSKIPLRISDAGQYVYSKFSLMVDRLNRKSLFVTKIANGIVSVFDKFEAGIYAASRAIQGLVDDLGGWDRVIRLVQAAMAALVGRAALGGLARLVTKLWGAKTALELLGAAAKRIGLLALFTAVVLVIEDFIAWMQGKKSVFSVLFGDWKSFNEQANEDLQVLKAAINEIIEAIKDLINFRFADAFAKLDDAFTTVKNQILKGIDEIAQRWKGVLPDWAKTLMSGTSKAYHVSTDWMDTAVDGFKKIGEATGLGGVGRRDPVNDSRGATGSWGPSVKQNFSPTINLTVPYGTPDDQQSFLRDAADELFNSRWQREMDHAAGEFAGAR